MFDYFFIEIGDTFQINGVSIRIRDKVIGTSFECEKNFLKLLYSSDYIIGNMSCLPVVLANACNSKIKNVSRNIVPNIRTIEDLEKLLADLDE